MRLLFVGDSNTLGLGAGGAPFPTLVGRTLEADGIGLEILNRGINGGTVATHVEQLPEYAAWKPDIVVLWVGGADALSVPRRDGRFDLVRALPPRYRQLGWLQPRPYLPSRWWKRTLYARPESYLRTRIGRLIMRLQGVRTVLPFDQFESGVRMLFEAFTAIGATVIACGPGPVDDAIFPGAEASFERFGNVVKLLARAHNARHVDLATVLRLPGHLLLDRFHPNARGHAVIAQALAPIVRDAIQQRAVVRPALTPS